MTELCPRCGDMGPTHVIHERGKCPGVVVEGKSGEGWECDCDYPQDLFDGTWEDLLVQAQKNLEEEMGEVEERPVAVFCENCGNPKDQLEQCKICLFFLCDKCTHSFPHKDIHERNIRHEERS